MPRGDGTGPMGTGPIGGVCVNRAFLGRRAGRGAGICGLGLGLGLGIRYLSRRKNSVSSLKSQKEVLEQRLSEINKELEK